MGRRDADHTDPDGTRREQTPERETRGAEERDREAERGNPEGVPQGESEEHAGDGDE